MAELSVTNPTLLDVASRMEDGEVAKEIIEIMSETNEIVDDATFLPTNDGTNHKTTVRTGLPKGTWRKLYQGVQPEKSTTRQIKDACGMLESYSDVDKALIDIAEDGPGFRKSEDDGFVEGLGQTFVDTLFYGDSSVDAEKFMGLAPRFNTKTLANAENAQNVIDGGGSGSDNTSIWLIVWGPRTAFCLYPKATQAGLKQKDLGEQTKTLADNSMFQVLRTHFRWDMGFCLRDWRFVVRIANIDVSDLTKNAATGADVCDLMVQALEKVQNLVSGRPAFYVNRTISSYLRRQMLAKANVNLTFDTVAGKKVMVFGEVPVRRCDAILNTEAALV